MTRNIEHGKIPVSKPDKIAIFILKHQQHRSSHFSRLISTQKAHANTSSLEYLIKIGK